MDRDPEPNPITVTLTFTGVIDGNSPRSFEGVLRYDALADAVDADLPNRRLGSDPPTGYAATFDFRLEGSTRLQSNTYSTEVVLLHLYDDVGFSRSAPDARVRDYVGAAFDELSFASAIYSGLDVNPYGYNPFHAIAVDVRFESFREDARSEVSALESDAPPVAFSGGLGWLTLSELRPDRNFPEGSSQRIDTSDFPLYASIDSWEFAIEGTGTPVRDATETEVSRIALLLAASEAGLETDTLNLWVDRAEAGLTRESIRAVLAPSVPEAETDGDYVEALFQGVLGRDPDFYGDRYWTGLLETGEMTRAAVWEAFALSPEHRLQEPDVGALTEIAPGHWDFA